MELINECSMRFAEDKDFRLLVRHFCCVFTIATKDETILDCR